MLLYFAAERSPFFDPRVWGLVSGLTLMQGRDPSRALLEAIAYGVRRIFDYMREAEGGEDCGGGRRINGGLGIQVVPKLTGRPQDLPEQTIGAS